MNTKNAPAESYQAMRNRHQTEFNQLPIHAAFGEEQFKKVLTKLDLSESKRSKRYYGSNLVALGFGTFILKRDVPYYKEVVSRQDKELKAAIAADKTGLGFIKGMFAYELANHEYGYTGDPTDTLEALGMTFGTLEKSPALMAGFKKACAEVMAAS